MRFRAIICPQIAAVDLTYQFIRSTAAVHAQKLVDFRFEPIIILFRGWRAYVEKVSEADNLPYELKEFRLPVLEGVASHLDRVLAEDRLTGMFGGILPKGIPAERPVSGDRNEKEQEGNPAVSIALHLSAPILANSARSTRGAGSMFRQPGEAEGTADDAAK
jgi:hypothetical protein